MWGRKKQELLKGLPPVGKAGDDTRLAVPFSGDSVQVSSFQGERPYQEDRFLVDTGLKISAAETRGFLTDLFQKTAARTNQNIPGSTATVAVVTQDLKLDAAFLGDSPLVAFIRDPATGQIETRRLTRDHHAAEPGERARIKSEGGVVSEGRIDGELMLSRAFGDAGYKGLSHDPEYAALDLKDFFDAGKEVYLSLASDGLYEQLSPKDYARTLGQAIAEGKTGSLADIFTARAYKSGSEDNMTALVVKIPPTLKENLFLAVADGHGGYQTAAAVTRSFAEVLKARP